MLAAIRNQAQSRAARWPFLGGRVERAAIRSSLRFDEPGKQPQALFRGPAPRAPALRVFPERRRDHDRFVGILTRRAAL